jgi:hypothetical protein
MKFKLGSWDAITNEEILGRTITAKVERPISDTSGMMTHERALKLEGPRLVLI